MLLDLMRRGDSRARDEVYEQSYDELRAIARRLLSRERLADGSATDLVNEAYVRKLKEGKFTAQSREHFYAIAARAMRSVLVEKARERQAAKRNSGTLPDPLHGLDVPAAQESPESLLAMEQAFAVLQKLDPAAWRVFRLRFFLGTTAEETAEILTMDGTAVRQNWEFARVWLRDRVRRR